MSTPATIEAGTPAAASPVGQPLSDEVVSLTAMATLRRHAASPLTGTPPFWERLVRTVLEAYLAMGVHGTPSAAQVAEVAAAAKPAFSGSPIVLSENLWRSIIDTVLVEYLTPSGNGGAIPRYLGNPRGSQTIPWRTA